MLIGLGDYMLLVHDDNGSKKLIDYYQQRGFQCIDEFIDKGMVVKVPSASTSLQ
jgi:hypothetical protein